MGNAGFISSAVGAQTLNPEQTLNSKPAERGGCWLLTQLVALVPSTQGFRAFSVWELWGGYVFVFRVEGLGFSVFKAQGLRFGGRGLGTL